ncbi:hypothetical protein [Larkinella rosea]|uniref:Uncharacterized protein n=1 Tax=Larkinella rosea TaxID=2025312 RepID=A0A3P1BUF3_9BACT|nr:hypothetical protein [Larkinella rosea]RRB04707.1 hypothetical protein EHT25_14650 [Larkinella rosea]
MTAFTEKGILEQLTTNPAKAAKMTPQQLDQMMVRIAGMIEPHTGIKLSWELPQGPAKSIQQDQLKTLAALYLGE